MDTRDLKAGQQAAVERMLNLNSPVLASGQWSEQWKVLIYDGAGRDIISPLLNVAQLRRNGVTLHMLLDSDREPIPDVPAVYFCRPTPENVKRIAKDCTDKLYASVHLNFISKLERRLMEDLARLVIEGGQVQSIAKVVDQHLDFVSLEPRLFSLNQKNSYAAYNGSSVSETSVTDTMRTISHGLFSVLATLGSVPMIRAPPNGPSEMVARQLCELVSQALKSGGAFSEAGSAMTSRPLVVIIDRALDLATPLQHTCTYQALVDDVLEYRMNRVTIDDPSAGGRKTYDLEVEHDVFWKKNAPRPFPEAIDDNSSELTRIKELEKEVKSKIAAGGGDVQAAAEAPISAESGTQELLATVDSLPQLLERKKKLESHTNILQAAMKAIAARELPVLFEAETTDRADQKGKLVKLLGPDGKGTLQDKLRLLAVVSLRGGEAGDLEAEIAKAATSPEEQAELEKGLEGIKHLRQMQGFNKQTPVTTNAASTSAGRGIGSWMQSKTAGILGQVQSFLAQSDDSYVTRVIENLCEFKAGSEDESFLTLDPKRKDPLVRVDPTPGSSGGSNSRSAPPREVLVFVVGGGCYAEYQHVQEYSKKHPERQITYGCTELVNGRGFLKQLSSLKDT